MKRDEIAATIEHLWRIHVPSGEPSLMRIFSTCLIADRMDSGPRDLCRSDRIQRLVGLHASCTGKNRVGHSLTRRQEREMTRINRGALLCYHSVTVPPLLPEPTIPVGPPLANPHTPRGTPHGHPRGPVLVASCHAVAPPTPRVSHPGSATWP